MFVAPADTPCASPANDSALRPYLSLTDTRGQLTSDTVVAVAPGVRAFHVCAAVFPTTKIDLYLRTLVLETVADGSTGSATP